MNFNPQLHLNDKTKMNFAFNLLTGTEYNWWYIKMMSLTILQSLDDFKVALRAEFIPFDHNRRTIDKVRKMVQNSSSRNT